MKTKWTDCVFLSTFVRLRSEQKKETNQPTTSVRKQEESASNYKIQSNKKYKMGLLWIAAFVLSTSIFMINFVSYSVDAQQQSHHLHNNLNFHMKRKFCPSDEDEEESKNQ